MQNILLVLICFGLGVILKNSPRFSESAHKPIHGFIIHISLPALVLYHIHKITITWDFALAAAMPWLVFLVSVVLFYFLHKIQAVDKNTMVALVFTSGFGNTSFVGLPLIQAYYGSESLGLAITIDQVGTFFCLGTLGVLYLFSLKNGGYHPMQMLKNIASFPPSQAFAVALLTNGWEYPDWLDAILSRLGDTLTPLALFTVGLQFNLLEMKNQTLPVFYGLSYKLIIAPLFVYFIYKNFINMEHENLRVVVLEASMAPMVTSTILAMENGFRPELCALILGFGILVSFGTTLIFYLLLL